jgi:hypothetical protein
MIAGSVRIALPASSPRSAAFLRTAASWASVLACLKLNPTTPGLVMGIKRSSGDLVWVVMMLPNGSAHPIPETYAGRRKKSSATFHQEAHWQASQPPPVRLFPPPLLAPPNIQRRSTRSLTDVCAHNFHAPRYRHHSASVWLAFLVPQVRKEPLESRSANRPLSVLGFESAAPKPCRKRLSVAVDLPSPRRKGIAL